jgi:hypothetical protein
LRQNALQRCAVGAYQECVAALDQARELDPSGESASAIREAREAAANSDRQRAIPNLPTGEAPTSVPDAQLTPQKLVPPKVLPKQPPRNKAEPKQFAPNKPEPKQPPPNKLEPKQIAPSGAERANVAPSQRVLSPDIDALDEFPVEAQKSKKR